MLKKFLSFFLLFSIMLAGCSSAEQKSGLDRNAENSHFAPADKDKADSYHHLEFTPPSLTNKSTLSIPGKISAESKVFINNEEQQVQADGFFTAVLHLKEGMNNIPIRVSAPNWRYTGSFKIEYIPDKHSPEIRLDLQDQYPYSHIIFNGKTGSGNEVTINKMPVIIQENGNFVTDIFLTPGTHLLNIVTTNPDRQSTTIQKVVKVIYPLKKPHLVVSMPEDPGFLSVDKVKITGFTDPDNLIEVYNNYYNSNGKEILSMICQAGVDSKGYFIAEIPLNPGPNKLFIRAIDPAGSVAEETRKVYSKNNYNSSFRIPKGNGYGYQNPNTDIMNEKYSKNYNLADEEDQI